MGRIMRTYCRDKQLVNLRREQIARYASRVFVHKGYTKTNIREIAKACRMSIGTLYHYIGSKEDILYLVFDYAMSRESKFIESISSTCDNLSPTEALRKAIEAYYQAIDEIQDTTVFMYQETKSLEPNARQHVLELERNMLSVFEKLLARGNESGEFKINDVSVAANNIVILGDAWAFRRWLLRKRYSTVEEYLREQTTHIFRGILAREDICK